MYRAVEKVSGSTHIVDATKAGLWGLALSRVPGIDLRVVHLVRDPVAYLDSDGQSRPVPYPPGAMRPPRPAGRSLITWLLLHLEADVLAQRDLSSITVLYEDLVRAPGQTAARVARAIGLDADVDADLRRRRAGGRPPRPCDRRQPASATPGANSDRASGAPRPAPGDTPVRPTDPVAGRGGSLPAVCGVAARSQLRHRDRPRRFHASRQTGGMTEPETRFPCRRYVREMRAPARRLLAASLVLLALAGCDSTFGQKSGSTEQSRSMSDLWRGGVMTAIVVGAIVLSLIIFSVLRYRRRAA